MLSLLKRKQKPVPEPEPLAQIECKVTEPVKRTRQQNIKASEDCCVAFTALAEAQGISKAALFEDLVAERLETLQRQGLELGISNR
jgi:hypothetical protein